MNNGGPTTVKVLKWGNPNGTNGGSSVSVNNDPSPSSFAGSSYATGSYPYENATYGDAGAVYGYGYTSSGPKIALKALLASAFLQYTTTAIAMPWEVGKVLLQVQWVPKRFEEGEFGLELELEMEDEEDNDELVCSKMLAALTGLIHRLVSFW
jgi:fusion and transport protein UGO1